MNLKALRSFIALYEREDCAAASRVLGIVPSVMSYRIRGLERALGVRLFERARRGWKPTPAGVRLYADARSLVAAVDGIVSSLKAMPR